MKNSEKSVSKLDQFRKHVIDKHQLPKIKGGDDSIITEDILDT